MQSQFDSAKVIIRPFEADDVLALYEAVRESESLLRRWMTWCGGAYTVERARVFVDGSKAAWVRGERHCFAIVDPETSTFLGSVGLNRKCETHLQANLGYWVRAAWAGKGTATWAVRLAARFGLHELGLNRLEILVPEGNIASLRVAQKVGAKFEGTLRNRLILEGKMHDAAMYSLVAKDAGWNRSSMRNGVLWARS